MSSKEKTEIAQRNSRLKKTHLSGISTLHKQVAGLHRASPSASLDKQYLIYGLIIAHLSQKINSLQKYLHFSSIYFAFVPEYRILQQKYSLPRNVIQRKTRRCFKPSGYKLNNNVLRQTVFVLHGKLADNERRKVIKTRLGDAVALVVNVLTRHALYRVRYGGNISHADRR